MRIVFLFLILTVNLSANNVFVDVNLGNDSNLGTINSPFKTIKKASSFLQASDTLFLREGVYQEEIRNIIPSGTSFISPTIVSSYNNEKVIIRPLIGSDRVFHFDGALTRFIEINGLILDGININYDVVKITYSSNVLNHAHHIRIKNCEIKNSASNQGILSTGGGNAGNNEFIGLDVHNNGNSEYDHGLYISSSNNIVERCRIHDNFGYGIHLYGDRGDINNNIVRRNRIYNNGSIADKAGILISGGDGNVVHHNVVYGHKYGIRVDYNVTNTKVFNNTVYGRDFMTGGISVGTTSTGAIVQNNLVYRTYPGNEIDDYGTGTTLSNNLEGVNPEWADEQSANFKLKNTSPAINKGVQLGFTEDIDGDLIDFFPDLGACEFVAIPSLPANLIVK